MSLSAQELMRQASMTAHDYLNHARDSVDQLFPQATPEQRVTLCAALVHAASADFAAMWLGQIADRTGSDVADSLADIADALARDRA